MGFYPRVKPGDQFQPNAALENDVRELVGQLGNFVPHYNSADWFGAVRIHVWNSGSDTIPAFSFVSPDPDANFIAYESEDESTVLEPLPGGQLVAPVSDAVDDPEHAWFSCGPIPPGGFGECIIRGPVFVTVSDDEDHQDNEYFAVPVFGSSNVTLSEDEGYHIIFRHGRFAVIDLSLFQKPEDKSGSFIVSLNKENGTLDVGPGFLNRNGLFSEVQGTAGITPESGWLCICSHIDDESGGWTEPEFEFSEPSSTAYPIAEITLIDEHDDDPEEGTDVKIRQMPISVAVILETAPCPLIPAENSNEE